MATSREMIEQFQKDMDETRKDINRFFNRLICISLLVAGISGIFFLIVKMTS